MKKLLLSIVFSLFVSNPNLYCDEFSEININEKPRNVFVQFDNDYTGINDKIASTVGLNFGYKFSDYFTAGVSLNGIWYDHRLNELDNEMSYHVESGYSALFVQGILPLSDRFDLSAMLISGQGFLQLKYDRKYQDELKWDEELIDLTNYSVAELKIGANYKINSNLKIGINTALRTTSEIHIESLETDMLQNIKYGFSIQYSIF